MAIERTPEPAVTACASLQRWTHETALALEARNAEVGHVYLHEMEETVATVQEEAPTYGAIPRAS